MEQAMTIAQLDTLIAARLRRPLQVELETLLARPALAPLIECPAWTVKVTAPDRLPDRWQPRLQALEAWAGSALDLATSPGITRARAHVWFGDHDPQVHHRSSERPLARQPSRVELELLGHGPSYWNRCGPNGGLRRFR